MRKSLTLYYIYGKAVMDYSTGPLLADPSEVANAIIFPDWLSLPLEL